MHACSKVQTILQTAYMAILYLPVLFEPQISNPAYTQNLSGHAQHVSKSNIKNKHATR